jgi:hypothetical protein
MSVGERAKYEYVITDPDTGREVDVLRPGGPHDCRGGDDICGGCDRCLLEQAEHAEMHIVKRPQQERPLEIKNCDGVYPWAFNCDCCRHFEYAPGEMLEPDQEGHHPSCVNYKEPIGAKARLGMVVQCNRAHRHLKKRVKQLAFIAELIGQVKTPCPDIGTDCPHLAGVFDALEQMRHDDTPRHLPTMALTDYPFVELGDTPGQLAPLREVLVLSYDGNKYCQVDFEGKQLEVKEGYLYKPIGRLHG